MKILITGGLGYIGSHTAVELIKDKHEVVIVDNLINSNKNILNKIKTITNVKPKFYKIDCTQKSKLERVFKSHRFDGVIHFAGLKSVGESVEKPLRYYYNNVLSTIYLVELSLKYKINRFVFSSSAKVYGNQKVPFKEDMELLETTNPYGESKVMSERVLKDAAKVNPEFKVSALRYFNPVGAHESGLIGESPNGIPNNLMPYITQVAKGIRDKLWIFGNDYDTPDGTGVRDYIHVVDLAKGHLKALKSDRLGFRVYNLGTGKGTSVFELINIFINKNYINIPYEITNRRPGDIAVSYADVTRAKKELKWIAKLNTEEMVKDAWNFEKKLN